MILLWGFLRKSGSFASALKKIGRRSELVAF
jgi:hypothetical protein